MKLKHDIKNWTIEIQNISELDGQYKKRVSKYFIDKLPYSIFIINKYLLIFSDSKLFIFSKSNDSLNEYICDYDDIKIISLRIKNNKSLLKIIGKNTFEFPFNEINDLLFFRGIRTIQNYFSKFYLNINESNNIDYLFNIDQKLYNYSKFTLLEDEKIIDSVYEAQNIKKNQGAHLSLLTNFELIFIDEFLDINCTTRSLFTGQWIYMPLRNIQKIEKIEKRGNNFNLIIYFNNKQKHLVKYNKNSVMAFKEFDKKISKVI